MQRLTMVRGAALLAATALAVAGMTACSSGGSDDSGEGGGELNLLAPQQHAGASEIWAKDFEEKTGTKVNVTLVPYDELQQKATLDVQSGAGEYDVFDSWYTEIGALAAGDIIVPIDDLAADSDPEDFVESIYDPYSLVDGERFGLPVDGDTQVLFYNKEILERTGSSRPRPGTSTTMQSRRSPPPSRATASMAPRSWASRCRSSSAAPTRTALPASADPSSTRTATRPSTPTRRSARRRC